MLRGYPVTCSAPGCVAAARFKIAAVWSDGGTHELKTYALCCPGCLSPQFALALAKHAVCVLAEGETLLAPRRLRTPGRGRPAAAAGGPGERRRPRKSDSRGPGGFRRAERRRPRKSDSRGREGFEELTAA